MDIQIEGVDLDWQRNDGKLPLFTIGSPRMFAACTKGTSRIVYLPDCEEAYRIMGDLIIQGIDIEPEVITSRIYIPLSTSTLFLIQIPGYELIVSSDPFLKHYSLEYI